MASTSQRVSTVASVDRDWSVEELADILDHIPAVVALWDNDLVSRFANDYAVEWLGKKHRSEVLGVRFHDLLPPAVCSANLPYAQAALRGQPQQFHRTFTNHAGEIRHTQASYTPQAVNGRVRGFFVHVTDITDRVEADAMRGQLAILQDREQVAARVHAQVTRQLSTAALDLSAALQPGHRDPASRVQQAIDSIDTAIRDLRALLLSTN